MRSFALSALLIAFHFIARFTAFHFLKEQFLEQTVLLQYKNGHRKHFSMLFSNPGPKYTQSSNRLNNGEKLIIASSVIKDVYIRPCISLIRHYMSKVWFIYLYFGCCKRIFFLIKICGWKDFMFRYDKFPGFGTPLIFFLECSPNKLFIQITLSRNARIQMDLSKNNRFSHQEATNYIPRIEKRKKGTSI